MPSNSNSGLADAGLAYDRKRRLRRPNREGDPMASDAAKANRILHVKIKTPSPDAAKLVATMMKNAAPMYRAFGDMRIRLLRNVDDQTRFLQVVDYQADQTI